MPDPTLCSVFHLNVEVAGGARNPGLKEISTGYDRYKEGLVLPGQEVGQSLMGPCGPGGR